MLNNIYNTNCYGNSDMIRNQGGLCLISPHYFSFASELIQKIHNEVNTAKVLHRRSSSFKVAWNNMISDKKLKQDFVKLGHGHAIEESSRDKNYDTLL